MPITVRDTATEHRHEADDGDQPAGISENKLAEHAVAFTHIQVDTAINGLGWPGLARHLVAQEPDDAPRRGLAVLDLVQFTDCSRFKLSDDPQAQS